MAVVVIVVLVLVVVVGLLSVGNICVGVRLLLFAAQHRAAACYWCCDRDNGS